MKYKILFDKNADKQLKKIDSTQQRIIINWIAKNLENTPNTRIFGKSLKGNLKGYWRYRMGNYKRFFLFQLRSVIINIYDKVLDNI